MKFVITGHRSGLGEALFLKLKYYYKNICTDVVGFDIIDGYDIGQIPSIAKIVWNNKNSDVFINNAYDNFGQTELLKYFLKSWRGNSSKLIVNIGSFLLDEPETFFKDFNTKEKEYLVEKRKQRNIINENRTIDPFLKVIQINPALLDTNFITTLDGNLYSKFILQNAMDTADLVIKIIDLLNNGIYTKEVTLNNLHSL